MAESHLFAAASRGYMDDTRPGWSRAHGLGRDQSAYFLCGTCLTMSARWLEFLRAGGIFFGKAKLPRAGRALLADAVGTMFGAATGTSTVTSYIESAAGVAAGARTGLGNRGDCGIISYCAIFSLRWSSRFLRTPQRQR